jgi:hypothetical protein
VNSVDPSGLGYFLVGYGYTGSSKDFTTGKAIPLGHIEYRTDTGRTYQFSFLGLQVEDTGVPPDAAIRPIKLTVPSIFGSGPLNVTLGNPSSKIDPYHYNDDVMEGIFREIKGKLHWNNYGTQYNCISVAQMARRIYLQRTNWGATPGTIDWLTPSSDTNAPALFQ